LGKYLILLGVIFIIAGLLFTFFPKINFIGKLPGDIHFRKGNFAFYFPLVTSILLSILVAIIVWVINYFSRK